MGEGLSTQKEAAPSVEEMLKEIEGSKPVIEWHREKEKLPVLSITLPYGCYVLGVQESEGLMHIEEIGVGFGMPKKETIAGRGIGTRLMRLFAAEALKHGVTELRGHIVTKAGLIS